MKINKMNSTLLNQIEKIYEYGSQNFPELTINSTVRQILNLNNLLSKKLNLVIDKLPTKLKQDFLDTKLLLFILSYKQQYQPSQQSSFYGSFIDKVTSTAFPHLAQTPIEKLDKDILRNNQRQIKGLIKQTYDKLVKEEEKDECEKLLSTDQITRLDDGVQGTAPIFFDHDFGAQPIQQQGVTILKNADLYFQANPASNYQIYKSNSPFRLIQSKPSQILSNKTKSMPCLEGYYLVTNSRVIKKVNDLSTQIFYLCLIYKAIINDIIPRFSRKDFVMFVMILNRDGHAQANSYHYLVTSKNVQNDFIDFVFDILENFADYNPVRFFDPEFNYVSVSIIEKDDLEGESYIKTFELMKELNSLRVFDPKNSDDLCLYRCLYWWICQVQTDHCEKEVEDQYDIDDRYATKLIKPKSRRFSTFDEWFAKSGVKDIIDDNQEIFLDNFSLLYGVPIVCYCINRNGNLRLSKQFNPDISFGSTIEKTVENCVHLLLLESNEKNHWVIGKRQDILLNQVVKYDIDTSEFVLSGAHNKEFCKECHRYRPAGKKHTCKCKKCGNKHRYDEAEKKCVIEKKARNIRKLFNHWTAVEIDKPYVRRYYKYFDSDLSPTEMFISHCYAAIDYKFDYSQEKGELVELNLETTSPFITDYKFVGKNIINDFFDAIFGDFSRSFDEHYRTRGANKFLYPKELYIFANESSKDFHTTLSRYILDLVAKDFSLEKKDKKNRLTHSYKVSSIVTGTLIKRLIVKFTKYCYVKDPVNETKEIMISYSIDAIFSDLSTYVEMTEKIAEDILNKAKEISKNFFQISGFHIFDSISKAGFSQKLFFTSGEKFRVKEYIAADGKKKNKDEYYRDFYFEINNQNEINERSNCEYLKEQLLDKYKDENLTLFVSSCVFDGCNCEDCDNYDKIRFKNIKEKFSLTPFFDIIPKCKAMKLLEQKDDYILNNRSHIYGGVNFCNIMA